MTDEIRAIINKKVEDFDKNAVKQREAMISGMEEKVKMWELLKLVDLPGVKIPKEMTPWELPYTSYVDVTNVTMFPEIQRLLKCRFEHYSKSPIGDGRNKKIQVSMKVKGGSYYLIFRFERKLTKNDKCKVVTQTSRNQTIVCTR